MKSLDSAYRIVRTPQGVRAFHVNPGGHRETVPHLVRHSPTGLEYGYEGSGPADLARSILGHLFEVADPAESAYQRFKREVIGQLRDGTPEWDRNGKSHLIPAETIIGCLGAYYVEILRQQHRQQLTTAPRRPLDDPE